MNRKLTALLLIFFDFTTSLVTWFFFFSYRKINLEKISEYQLINTFLNERFWIGGLSVSFFWITLYSIHGMYQNVYRKSRLKDFTQTAWICIIGSLAIFFALILDDILNSYKDYYQSFLVLLSLQFTLNFIPKFITNSIIANKIHSRKIGFNTLIIGKNKRSLELLSKLNSARKSAGYFIVGYVDANLNLIQDSEIDNHLKCLGILDDIDRITIDNNIEEVIICVDPKNHEKINTIATRLKNLNVNIKVLPDMYNILSGQVKMNSILHEALIDIKFSVMPQWQAFTKRIIDIVIPILVLTIFSPLYLTLIVLVKISSKGPVFFKQERIGKNGEPFKIIKFRSMYVGAEKGTPKLSKDNDDRITPIGRFLRKTRMDEMPQFYNVLVGEMSIVGPRPERQFYIDQIVQKAPEYTYLHRIKPGITSWGQVKYGYAENVDEMIERLKFDLLYLDNRSLLIDFKIIIHTILVVLQGRGK